MKKRVISGILTSVMTFSLYFNTPVLADGASVIKQQMNGDIIITSSMNEGYFNGAGSNTPAMGKLTSFTLSGDINVDTKYINSVKYTVKNRIASLSNEAVDMEQSWYVYLVDGGFDEFGINAAEATELSNDTSVLLCEEECIAEATNVFDITEGYKENIENISGDTFILNLKLEEYPTVFNTGNNYADNFLTYEIDTGAIKNDLADADDIESFILRNGAAIGINVYNYARIADKSDINDNIKNADCDIIEINSLIASANDDVDTDYEEISRSSDVYKYTEKTNAQNAAADFKKIRKSEWMGTSNTYDKLVYVFELNEDSLDMINSARVTLKRPVDQGLLFVASSDSMSFRRLNFIPVKDKLYDSKNVNTEADITKYIDGKYIFVGLNGALNEPDGQSTVLKVKYNVEKVLQKFETASITEANVLLTKFGKLLGMTNTQLKSKSKVAIALSGKTIGSKSEFLQMVENGISNVSGEDIIAAVNTSADIDEFIQYLKDFKDIIGIELDILDSMDEDSQNTVWNALYADGKEYASVAELSAAYYEEIDNIYRELLAGIDPYDVDATKIYLLEKGELLGISAKDLENNIDKIALAMTSGKQITSIIEFRNIYENYEEKAGESIVAIINRAEDADEFESLMKEYASVLGLDFGLYDMLEDKSGIYSSVKGAAKTPEEFKNAFDNEISRYFTVVATVYTNEETWIWKNQSSPAKNDEGWIGVKDDTNQLLKYNLSAVQVDPDDISLATLTLKVSNRSEHNAPNNIKNTLTMAVSEIGTNWSSATDYYQTLIDNNVYENEVEIGQGSLDAPLNNKKLLVDITEYIKQALKDGKTELAFRAYKTAGNAILERKGDKTNFDPIEIRTIDALPATCEYEATAAYDGISTDTDIKITFDRAIDETTANDSGFTVTDIEGNPVPFIVEKIDDTTLRIKFKNKLSYETRYTVQPTKELRFAGDSKKYVFNSYSFETEKVSFEIKDMILKSNGVVINSLDEREKDTVNASVTVNNNSSFEPKKVIVMLALYKEKDGYVEMVDIKTSSRNLALGQSIVLSKDFNVPKPSDNGTGAIVNNDKYMIVCNVWDSLTNMNTLFNQRVE